MDIDVPNEYVNQYRRRRQYRLLALGAVILVVVVGTGLLVNRKRSPPPPKSRNRLFAFEVGNLDGNANETGTIYIQTRPDWAPIGVDRFHNLVESDFFTDCRFFRIVPEFVVQFGINGDPEVEAQWNQQELKDDPVVASNTKGTVTFATAGENTRTTQLFINFEDNTRLDDQGFAPIGEVVDGMDIVERIYDKWRQKPDQQKLISKGNDYLLDNFPGLSYVIAANPSV